MNIVTTSQKSNIEIQKRAVFLSKQLSLQYVKRCRHSVADLFSLYDSEFVAILSEQGLNVYFAPDRHHTFHLSMAQLRLLKLKRGGQDHLTDAVQLLLDRNHHKKDSRFSFLDCTLGLSSDSIVVSYAFPSACVEGLEAVYPIWLSTWYGLNHYDHGDRDVTDALRRIKAVQGNCKDRLFSALENSVDIIYIDPMFEVPVLQSPQFLSLRDYTEETEITVDIIQAAKRAARFGCIIKERPFSSIFSMYPPDVKTGGKYSRIGYGIYFSEVQ